MGTETRYRTLDMRLTALGALIHSKKDTTMTETPKADRAPELVLLDANDGMVMTREESMRYTCGQVSWFVLILVALLGFGLPTTARVVLGVVGFVAVLFWAAWFRVLLPDGEQMEARRERYAAQQAERSIRQATRQANSRATARERGRRLLGLAPLSGDAEEGES